MIGEGEHTTHPAAEVRGSSPSPGRASCLLWLGDKRYGQIAFAHRLALPTNHHLLNTLVDQVCWRRMSPVGLSAGYVAALAIMAEVWRARRLGTGGDIDLSESR